ncbi:hypothetical protein CLU79DRAFT_777070, partial [Phycomyces nitens]
DEIESPIDPVLATSLFFIERQPCLTTHSRSSDQTIQLLYATARSEMTELTTYSNNFEETLSNICSTNTVFLERIQREVEKLPVPHTIVNKHIDTAIDYNKRIKL